MSSVHVKPFSTSDVDASELLRIRLNAPVVLARRIVVDTVGTAVFVSDIAYRGDYVRFDVDLLPGTPFDSTAGGLTQRRSGSGEARPNQAT